MRDFRIRTENADGLIKLLKEAGYKAEYSKCRPKTNWNNGCSDPDCCDQHPSAIIEEIEGVKFAKMPDTWTAITSNASSNQVHHLLQILFDCEIV